MSWDTVDMLHEAEDRIGLLESILEELVASMRRPASLDHATPYIIAIRAANALAVEYCRCDLDDEGVCEEGPPECGCPHHNREEELFAS